MTKRRSRGDGGLHWDEQRQRWIASVTVGYHPDGRRIVRKASDPTKSGALRKLKEKVRDLDDGLAVGDGSHTVADAVKYWLEYGLSGRSPKTVKDYRGYAENHVIPGLGSRKLRDLTVEDVERWLNARTGELSTRSLRILHSILNRSVKKAQAMDRVKRNVVELAEIPEGRAGRPSKSLTLAQAEAVLSAAPGYALEAYVVLSILTGARTEELRALTWALTDLDGQPAAFGMPIIPPSIMVWRSDRTGGDTKTPKSRRTLAMPLRCVEALRAHKVRQDAAREKAGDRWQGNSLVFCTRTGRPLSADNVKRDIRPILKKAGLKPEDWTPREFRHTFVSLLSDSGVPLESISRLVGHQGTAVTELVYRHQIRPVIQDGATAMDEIFPAMPGEDEETPGAA
ncbi:site-specific integrase [Actinocorallia longicatena]|uniref:Site-specific integrase n=1 Tax=Actinocorallia longicatena TaxID=111803 RepID=A0ABP6QH87_9ACTN